MERGDNRVYRWYIANPVRFQQSLKVQIQNQHANDRPTTTGSDDYTSVQEPATCSENAIA